MRRISLCTALTILFLAGRIGAAADRFTRIGLFPTAPPEKNETAAEKLSRQRGTIIAPTNAVDRLSPKPKAHLPEFELGPVVFKGDRISGIVTNNTALVPDRIVIEFALHDASGARMGTASDRIENLRAYEQWKFSCAVSGEGVAFATPLRVGNIRFRNATNIIARVKAQP